MTQVVVGTEVETWQVQPPEDSDEPYSYRGETGGRVTNVTGYIVERTDPYYGDSHGKDIEGIEGGDSVWAVVVEYSTGDTFGRDGGQSVVLDFFTDLGEATALADRAGEHDSRKDGYGFQHNGVDYYTPWCGYFESLDSIDVWEVVVRGPRFTKAENGHTTWNIRRGH